MILSVENHSYEEIMFRNNIIMRFKVKYFGFHEESFILFLIIKK